MTQTTTAVSKLIAPHGGRLIDRTAAPGVTRGEAAGLPVLSLNARQLSDAQLIAQGAFSPLEGFMTSADYKSVLGGMHLANGLPWSLPITLAVSAAQAAAVAEGKRAALAGPNGEIIGFIDVQERFDYDKEIEAEQVFRTTEEAHPGVAGLYASGEVLVGGPITLFSSTPALDPTIAEYYGTPAAVRAELTERGWSTMVGFQTRNPVHRAHEYIQKTALEIVDGMLLHPLVGETKSDDIPANVRMRCYRVLLDNYYPLDRVHLSVFPAFMRYAGPREAVFHAIVRKNYGCSHFIVGRDHAGVGSYYGPYDAQHIFSEFDAGALGITPLFFENSFYCKSCQGMASSKTCPHPAEARISLSGTEVRRMLDEGTLPPPEFSRPEVAQVLIEAYATPENKS